MRHFLLLVLFFVCVSTTYAQLWEEDFSAENNGAQSGNAAGTLAGPWSVTVNPGSGFSVSGNRFGVNNTSGEGTWSTSVMDISTAGYAIIEVDVIATGIGFSSSDYISLYYRLDGGPEILFTHADAGWFDISNDRKASAIVAANTLQVIIKGRESAWLGSLAFDNVTITAAPIIYSRTSGDWNNASTWSLISHTGTSCSCFPLNNQVAIIGPLHTVSLSSSKTNVGNPPTTNLAPGAVDVHGTLNFASNAVTLGVQKGLVRTRTDGSIKTSSAGITGSQISFQENIGGAALAIDPGGSVNIANLTLASSASNYHYLTGGGSLSISSDISINAQGATLYNNLTSPISVNGNIFVNQNSALINNGSITLSSASAGVLNGQGSWIQGANSTLNYAGSTLTVGSFNASASGNVVNYNRNGDQTLDAPSGNSYYHLTISGSGTKTSSSNLDINGDLLITGSARLDVNAGSDDINLAGNWTVTSTNSDPFVQGTRTVTLDGSAPQSLSTVLAGGATFYRLNLNNSSGTTPQFIFNDNVTVTSVLDMDRGIVNLMGNTLTLSSTGSGALDHNGNSGSGWVYNGAFARARPNSSISVGSAQSLFPLGSASDWRPFWAGQDNGAGVMTVTHTNSTSTSDVNIVDNLPTSTTATITKRHNSFWTPRTTATGGTYVLRAGGANFGVISNRSHLRMVTSTGVAGNHVAASTPDWSVNRNNVSRAVLNANNFHLASTNANNSPLPIELLSFSARLNNNEVDIRWSTASEVNNDFFTIERTSNPETFESLIAVDGKGTSKELNKYQIIDSTPLYGRSYYRLKQTDFDGKVTYSSVQVIDYSGPTYTTLTASPNPLNEPFLTIRVDGLKEATHVPIQILDVYGQTVFEKMFEVTTPGRLEVKVPAETFTTAGFYVIKAGKTKQLTQKIVIE